MEMLSLVDCDKPRQIIPWIVLLFFSVIENHPQSALQLLAEIGGLMAFFLGISAISIIGQWQWNSWHCSWASHLSKLYVSDCGTHGILPPKFGHPTHMTSYFSHLNHRSVLEREDKYAHGILPGHLSHLYHRSVIEGLMAFFLGISAISIIGQW